MQELLEATLGSESVYFQPPETIRMRYPCIVYERDKNDVIFANNSPYCLTHCYTVTFICEDPDSEIPDKIARLPLCSMERHFSSDNLYHYVFRLYF